MKLERFNSAKRNSFWGIVYKFVTLFFPFAIRSILIKTLGVEYLGLNALFTSILNILNLTELGVGSAIVFSMYKPIAQNDEKKICALMNLYKKLYRYIGVAVLLIGVIILPFLGNFISSDVPKDINIYILYSIYLSNSVISYWLFAYKNCLLNVHLRGDITSKISIVINSLMYLTQIIMLFLTKNYYVYIIIMPVFSILLNLCNAYFADKLFPQYKCKGRVDKNEMKEIRKRVSGLMVTKIAYASRNSFDSIIISSFLGLQAVAIYNNYYYISNSISDILVIFTTSIYSGIGNSVEKNIKDLEIINFLYFSISGFCFSFMIALYQPFMNLWVGDKLLVSDGMMILFAIYFLTEKTLNVIGQYFDASGLWWKGKWKGLIETSANLLLNVLLCHFFGMYGVIIATIITIIFIGFPLTTYYTYKYEFNMSSKKFLFMNYIYIIIFIIIGLIIYCICLLIPYGNTYISQIGFMIIRLMLVTVVTTICYLLFFFRMNIFKESFKWLKSHIK